VLLLGVSACLAPPAEPLPPLSLEQAATDVDAPRPITPNDTALHPTRNEKSGPRVATDPGTGETLTVWAEDRTGVSSIWGARTDGAGAVIDEVGVLISAPLTGAFEPDVTYNGREYLVVWLEAGDGGSSVAGRIVPKQGPPGNLRTIITNDALPERPAIASVNDGGAGVSIVLWSEQGLVRGRPLVPQPLNFSLGAPFRLHPDSTVTSAPAIGGGAGLYAAWVQSPLDGGASHIAGAWLDVTGADAARLDRYDAAPGGTPLRLAVAVLEQQQTAMVLWEEAGAATRYPAWGFDGDAVTHRLVAENISNPQLTAMGREFASGWVEKATGNLVLSRFTRDGGAAPLARRLVSETKDFALAGDSKVAGNRIALAERVGVDTYDVIHWQRVAGDGGLVGNSPLRLSYSAARQVGAAVSAAGAEQLLAWVEERGSVVLVQTVIRASDGSFGTVRQVAAASMSDKRDVAVAYDGAGTWFVVWLEAAPAWSLVGRTVQADGGFGGLVVLRAGLAPKGRPSAAFWQDRFYVAMSDGRATLYGTDGLAVLSTALIGPAGVDDVTLAAGDGSLAAVYQLASGSLVLEYVRPLPARSIALTAAGDPSSQPAVTAGPLPGGCSVAWVAGAGPTAEVLLVSCDAGLGCGGAAGRTVPSADRPAIVTTYDGLAAIAGETGPFSSLGAVEVIGGTGYGPALLGLGARPAAAFGGGGRGVLAYQRFELDGTHNNFRVLARGLSTYDGGGQGFDAGAPADAGSTADGGPVPLPPDGGRPAPLPTSLSFGTCGCQSPGAGLLLLAALALARRRVTRTPARR